MGKHESTMMVGVELVGAHTVDSRAFWLDLVDRTLRTFLQTVLLFLVGGATVVDISWTSALSSAALAALVSLLLALATSTAITSGNLWIDLADRAARTFAATLVAAIPATGTLSDVHWREVVSLALTATLISVLTSLTTVNVGPAKGLPSAAPVLPEVLATQIGVDALDDDGAVGSSGERPRVDGDGTLEREG